MRQMVITRHGAPDVLRLREAPDPQPGPGEVRIRVKGAGVNFADLLARVGLYPDAPAPPLVVGYEVAGIVDAVGPGVTGPPVGERVVALTRFGGYADAVVSPTDFVFPVPRNLTDVEAAAIPVTYLTAWIALYRCANLQAGDTVLVRGAGGGVGIAASQLARLRGARVLGAASRSKHAALHDLGIDELIDSSAGAVGPEVRRLTGNRGVDVVLDPIGGRSFTESYRLLAPLGRLVMFGVSSVAPTARRRWWQVIRTMATLPSFRPIPMMNANRGVFGINLGHLWNERQRLADVMNELLGEFEAARLRPVVARTFPLEEAAAAHRFMHERQNVGKVVLTVE